MNYKELKANEGIHHSSIRFSTIEELMEKISSIKNSSIKTISLCKTDIGENSWETVRSILLEGFSGTDVNIIIYV